MKVWELIEKLSKQKAGDNVLFGIPKTKGSEENSLYGDVSDFAESDNNEIIVNLKIVEEFNIENAA